MSTTSTPPMTPENAGWRMGMGTLLQGLNSSMIVVAIVSISTTFHNTSAIPWLISSLYFTAAICSPTSGHLADLFGARRVYYAGLTLTVIASCIGPFCPNIWTLVAVRALIGIGTATQMPAAVAVIMSLSQQQRKTSSPAVGTLSMLGQVSSAIGPVLGGIIVSILGWRWIFWINIPLAINAAYWTWKVPVIPVTRNQHHARIDKTGISIFCTLLITLLYGLLATDVTTALLGIGCTALLSILFFICERKHEDPFIDFDFLLCHRRIIYIYIRTIVVNIAFYAIFYGIPQWSETEGGMTATQAGLVMLPNFVAGIITTKLAAAMAARWSAQRLRLIGGALTIASMIIGLAAFNTGNLPLFYLAAFFLGLPSGFNVMGNQIELNQTVPQEHLGQATGLFRTMQFVGAAISTPLVHQILETPSYNHITMILVVIGMIGVVSLMSDIYYRQRVCQKPRILHVTE